MPYWTIYVCDPGLVRARTSQVVTPGQLWALVDVPPDREGVAAMGLGVAYFGKDAPDLEALIWCPERLTFVGRALPSPGAGSAALESLRGVLAQQSAELARLSSRMAELEAPAPRDPMAEQEAPAPRAPWWRRILLREK
jgi:hypothetical protein